jgi:hypothetical protein
MPYRQSPTGLVMEDFSFLPADQVLGLPVDELARHVLRHIGQDGSSVNWRAWMGLVKQYNGYQLDERRALSEAWCRLQNHGFIAWDPRQGTQECFFITRLGRETLQQEVGGEGE